MKLLHTADLHLGLCRGSISRWNDHIRVLDEILAYVEKCKVDVLLFVGDIFHNRTKRDLADIAADFLQKLVPTLRRGTDIVLVSGNHDNRDLFHLMGTLLQEVAGEDTLPLLICHKPGVYDLSGHKTLQVVALPYLSPSVLQSHESFSDKVMEGAELHQTIGATLERGLQWLESQVDPSRPAIFAGHILVSGSQASSGIELDYAHDIAISPQSLPHYTQYNALGHIHLCQQVNGASRPSWYPGAPDRQDMGERSYEPCLLLVELTMKPGEPCEPTELPIHSATPFVRESLNSANGVADFLADEPSPRTLGMVQITCTIGEFADLRRQVLRVCPHLDVIINPTDDPYLSVVDLPKDPYDVQANVQRYLEDKFAGEELERLKEAFAELYGEVSSHAN
jgi:exonuclease SbcD